MKKNVLFLPCPPPTVASTNTALAVVRIESSELHKPYVNVTRENDNVRITDTVQNRHY